MLIKIHKNRSVSSAGTWGTKNENNYEILDFEFPEELEEYNKRIVYYLGNQKVWDAIIDNKAILTNAITTKGSVKAYIWCTKSDEAFETDVDFRTQIFVMNFFENDNADGIVPTEQQVDGFNTMLTAMNAKIDEVDALETTIEAAEEERQEAEASRVSNETTRESNEATRQSNEQTRQTQEADRERRTNEAISSIQDKTAEYNANAEAKTTAFNNNATQKTNEFNDLVHAQELAIENYGNTQLNAIYKKGQQELSSITTTTQYALHNISLAQQTGVSAVETASSEAITDFNTNATNKTNAFNDNATQKTTNFDNNASEKTDEFNTNAQEKIDEYDEHIVEYQAQIDELQEEVDELSENMPWNTTEQATEISVDDAAKYSRNKLELFGNTEQAQLEVIETLDIIDGVITDDGTIEYGQTSGKVYILPCKPNNTYTIKKSNTTHRFSACDYPTIIDKTTKLNNKQDGVTSQLEMTYTTSENANYMYIFGWYSTAGDTEDNIPIITAEIGINPDYPQDIHVVTGENDIYWTSNENKLDLNKNYIKGGINSSTGAINATAKPTITLGNNSISVYTSSAWNGYISDYYDCQSKDIIQLNFVASTNYFWVAIAEYDLNKQYIKANPISNTSLREINIKTTNETKYLRLIFEGSRSGYSIDFTNINFVIQNHVILNLGSLELRKIGDYQDYLYKENGNWYKYGAITKIILDGTENWEKSGIYNGSYYINKGTSSKFYIVTAYSPLFCSHFICADINYGAQISNYKQGTCFVENTLGNFNVWYDDGTITLNDFRTWLSENNLVVYCVLKVPSITQITDETLIAQLDEIYEHLKLVKGTNDISITASDLKPYMKLSYMQDLKSKLDNLDSRLALLE